LQEDGSIHLPGKRIEDVAVVITVAAIQDTCLNIDLVFDRHVVAGIERRRNVFIVTEEARSKGHTHIDDLPAAGCLADTW
jgi:hypothetical protein